MERSAVTFMYINKLYDNYVDNDKNKELDILIKKVAILSLDMFKTPCIMN